MINRKQKCDETSPAPVGALYVHVPFCRSRCRYCDFYSNILDEKSAREYVHAVARELDANAAALAKPLETIYIGGGTPTSLPRELLESLLGKISPLSSADTEFTIEANPGTVTAEISQMLVRAGVNRVSLGSQSFIGDELRLLGRSHTAEQIVQAVGELRSAGVDNLSLDLIYGIPGQSADSWADSMRQAMALAPEHLSCYALSFEPGTPLAEELAQGRLAQTDDEFQRQCYYTAIAMAGQAGLEHYEISNFARAGRACKHNLTYWRNNSYLGIGPAAASYIHGVRRTNIADLGAYVSAIVAGTPSPCAAERLTGAAAAAEALMLELRLIEGVNRDQFRRRYGCDPLTGFPRTFGRYQAIGALLVSDSHIRISPESLFVSDAIAADLLAEA